MSIDNDDATVCIINSTMPMYQPNIFLCSPGSSCCTRRGIIACCQNDVSFSQVLKQSLPFLVLWLIIFGIATLVHLFFEDDETGKSINKEKPLNGKMELLLPIENDYTVEDPVFGKLYEHQVPKMATIPKKRR
ncbi:uncharacterized protein CELE_F28F9.2 [Caenorhabditis elegans]|uniref:Uncharacterized protein n=1 Tax=Caenorhabditis elegans TaxID=6239 RepID=Q94195_CAEEL|nr:Uncharacterized protein CELE_F28F9.2 [Caenorhabditis elegans]CCD70187.1 Uncharacterized protein CELE_F28F9.2 [Caenorhabditis elegans]|eukprot:NP_500423.2 Uncharacterized protein CELE_F28F9.2 [Caenorhabditis elegans]